ncbi:hypothetical protein VNO80_02044 [Phaseolus coccineus]|uniref:Bromo domain-containing protein n=1 Tax=Phaseolus coccineus TaxID=3886 RepID=A0AAN9X0E9_PHACN
MIDNESDKSSKLASSSFLPETRILQLVLDTLQRKDTYEIFVEPVDPNEVEDYYAIIEEPMDFGTIRAKLHERMYKTLEQFEACVINELAKKVFDILKKNPKKFEMEYSEIRRKTGRSNQRDFRNSRNSKSNEISISVPSKTMSCSSRSTLNKRSCKTNHLEARNVEITTGTKECNKCKSLESDRRGMYKPLRFDKDNSILPIINGQLKLLQHVGQQDIGYKDSLMLFAKDLGPIAQNIAKRKILGCKILMTSTSAPYTSSMISYHLDHFHSYPSEIRSPREETSGREAAKGILNVENNKGCNPLNGNIWECHKWPLRCDKEFLSKRFCFVASKWQWRRRQGKAMAYRRRQGISRTSTFKEEIPPHADAENGNAHPLPSLSSSLSFTPSSSSSSSSPSLAAQAIKASAARRDPSLHFAFPKSEHDHHRSKSCDNNYVVADVSKSGVWGVLAQKAKEILEDDKSSPHPHHNAIASEKLKTHSFNTFAPPLEAMESKASSPRSPIKLKGSSPSNSKSHQAPGTWNPWQQPAQTGDPQTIHTQLKASRDVAMATAAKAKLLLRELKTVKADLAFSKARCGQLEEENKILRDREGSEKGENITRADDDLIRLQLETLLAEKGRLASENEVYARENRFLREIVEYHQLSMQDVVYLDEGMEEVAELYPIDTTCTTAPGVPRVQLPRSPRSPLNRGSQKKSIFSVPPQQHQEEEEEYGEEAEDKKIASELDEHAVAK